MSQKESTEKLGKSWFRNFASQLWANIIPALPPIVSDIMKEIQKNSPTPSALAWDNWCDKLAANNIIDSDTAELIKGLSTDPFPVDIIEMIITKVKVFTAEIDSIMNIYSLDRQYANLSKTTPNPAPVDNLIRSMIIDPKRSTENRA